MAYAMMGGIIVGTLLTLLFLPALRTLEQAKTSLRRIFHRNDPR